MWHGTESPLSLSIMEIIVLLRLRVIVLLVRLCVLLRLQCLLARLRLVRTPEVGRLRSRLRAASKSKRAPAGAWRMLLPSVGPWLPGDGDQRRGGGRGMNAATVWVAVRLK